MSDKNATITDFARELAATRGQLAAAQARAAELSARLREARALLVDLYPSDNETRAAWIKDVDAALDKEPRE